MDDRMTTLVATRGPALVGYAYLLAGSIQEAEDLVQDALVRTFSRRRAGTDMEWLEAYVRRAVLNAYLDRYRKERRRRAIAHLMHDDAAPVHPDDLSTRRVDVRRALEALPPRERACVVLHYYEDMAVRDVAERLDVNEGTVKRYLANARERLHPLLGGDEWDHIDVSTDRRTR